MGKGRERRKRRQKKKAKASQPVITGIDYGAGTDFTAVVLSDENGQVIESRSDCSLENCESCEMQARGCPILEATHAETSSIQ